MCVIRGYRERGSGRGSGVSGTKGRMSGLGRRHVMDNQIKKASKHKSYAAVSLTPVTPFPCHSIYHPALAQIARFLVSCNIVKLHLRLHDVPIYWPPFLVSLHSIYLFANSDYDLIGKQGLGTLGPGRETPAYLIFIDWELQAAIGNCQQSFTHPARGVETGRGGVDF